MKLLNCWVVIELYIHVDRLVMPYSVRNITSHVQHNLTVKIEVFSYEIFKNVQGHLLSEFCLLHLHC